VGNSHSQRTGPEKSASVQKRKNRTGGAFTQKKGKSYGKKGKRSKRGFRGYGRPDLAKKKRRLKKGRSSMNDKVFPIPFSERSTLEKRKGDIKTGAGSEDWR